MKINFSSTTHPYLCRVLNYFYQGKDSAVSACLTNWSAEKRVAEALLSQSNLEDFEVEVGLRYTNIRNIRSQKILQAFYLIGRVIRIFLPDELKFYLKDQQDRFLYRKQFERYSSSILSRTELKNDQDYLDSLEIYLSDKENRLRLIRILSSEIHCYDQKSRKLYELLLTEFCSIQFYRRNKVRPKRTVRHKGYRDHGSLRPSWKTAGDADSLTEKENNQRLAKIQDDIALNAYNSNILDPQKSKKKNLRE